MKKARLVHHRLVSSFMNVCVKEFTSGPLKDLGCHIFFIWDDKQHEQRSYVIFQGFKMGGPENPMKSAYLVAQGYANFCKMVSMVTFGNLHSPLQQSHQTNTKRPS